MTHPLVRSVAAPAPPAPASPPLRRREEFAYGAGDLASNLSWNFVGSFLLFYYTDVAGVPIAVLGTLFLVARLLDAVVDPSSASSSTAPPRGSAGPGPTCSSPPSRSARWG